MNYIAILLTLFGLLDITGPLPMQQIEAECTDIKKVTWNVPDLNKKSHCITLMVITPKEIENQYIHIYCPYDMTDAYFDSIGTRCQFEIDSTRYVRLINNSYSNDFKFDELKSFQKTVGINLQ